jgi:hypothetical protein
MKKMMIMLAAFAMAALFAGSSAMAFEKAGFGTLEMGTTFAPGNSILNIGLSPKVYGVYFTDGVGASDAQWFTIGAGHPGGNELYGTAQNLTNTYKKKFEAGTTFAASIFELPTGPNSAEDWSNNDWTY